MLRPQAVEHHWDLGYRGLIPRALARRLGSPRRWEPEEALPEAAPGKILICIGFRG